MVLSDISFQLHFPNAPSTQNLLSVAIVFQRSKKRLRSARSAQPWLLSFGAVNLPPKSQTTAPALSNYRRSF